MRVFVTVVETGGFASAASALGLTRPHVTLAIRRLEETVGARLLHRTTRSMSLTAEGGLFLDRSRRLLTDADDARSLFGGGAARGGLRVDLPVALAKALVAPRLGEFIRRYPEIRLSLGVSDATVDLVAAGVDCAVRLGELSDSSLVGKRIASLAMVTCAAPAYLEEHGTPTTVEDLQAHRAVSYCHGSERRVMEWRVRCAGEERTLRMRDAVLVNDTDAFLACGLAGVGLMQALGITVAPHLKTGALSEILNSYRPSARSVWVLHPSRRLPSPQLQAFVDWLTEIMSEASSSWVSRDGGADRRRGDWSRSVDGGAYSE
ncbi:LysR family transcriptional regulator [Lichenicoccus roseus]|nr:LysR family transcriptional regulator [Lichenicoccus roseus]